MGFLLQLLRLKSTSFKLCVLLVPGNQQQSKQNKEVSGTGSNGSSGGASNRPHSSVAPMCPHLICFFPMFSQDFLDMSSQVVHALGQGRNMITQ